MLGFCLWSLALGWFVATLPREALPATQSAEAIVILTGGSGRVEHGLRMLAAGAAPLAYISGVGANATEDDLLNTHATGETRDRIYERGGEIVLDHVARSTVSNADQATSFLKARGIQTVRLVTADYHMRRSLYEFRTAMPELTVLSDPVFPENFEREYWWEHENSRRLVFSEFYKYYAVLIRDWIRP
jgi:uncharacterized SAM-binding protein YcdF (DUF218 family)